MAIVTEQQPWRWPESTWREHVALVRAGRRLAPSRWPGGARCAVALSFDSDHETISLRDAETSPGALSRGEYGARVGVPRILDLLAVHGIPATFYVPAVCALLRPDEIRSYVDAGHEVAMHGWIHERNTLLDAATERELALRAADALESTSGSRPAGIRTPSWDFSPHTLDITRELGLAYDSSLMADDDCYEILAGGEPTGIVEVPVEWIRDDAPYFTMDRFSQSRPYTAPRQVLTLWRDEFDGAHAAGGLFQLTLHPHVIGHRSRMAVLADLVAHIAEHRDVWFATHAQVASYVLATC